MYENNSQSPAIHNIIMENRKKLTISGVKRVENFDDNIIVLDTQMGQMTLKGENLHISKMDIDIGNLSVSGNFYGLIYNETSNSNSFFKRIFK